MAEEHTVTSAARECGHCGNPLVQPKDKPGYLGCPECGWDAPVHPPEPEVEIGQRVFIEAVVLDNDSAYVGLSGECVEIECAPDGGPALMWRVRMSPNTVREKQLKHQHVWVAKCYRTSEARAESGTMQFGDDWPGLFLRGDFAGPAGFQLGQLLDSLPKSENALADFVSHGIVRSLANMLSGTEQREGQKKTVLRSFAECEDDRPTVLKSDFDAKSNEVGIWKTKYDLLMAEYNGVVSQESDRYAAFQKRVAEEFEGIAIRAYHALAVELGIASGDTMPPVLEASLRTRLYTTLRAVRMDRQRVGELYDVYVFTKDGEEGIVLAWPDSRHERTVRVATKDGGIWDWNLTSISRFEPRIRGMSEVP